MELSRECKKVVVSHKLENGDTEKHLLARSRYLLFKGEDKWAVSQAHRAEILFRRYPDLEKAYKLSRSMGRIYPICKLKCITFTKLAPLCIDVEEGGLKSFNLVSRIQNHYTSILKCINKNHSMQKLEHSGLSSEESLTLILPVYTI